MHALELLYAMSFTTNIIYYHPRKVVNTLKICGKTNSE